MTKGPRAGRADGRDSDDERLALWWAPLDPPAEQADRLASLLSDDERARAARYRRPIDAEHYRVGRGRAGGSCSVPSWVVTPATSTSNRTTRGSRPSPGPTSGSTPRTVATCSWWSRAGRWRLVSTSRSSAPMPRWTESPSASSAPRSERPSRSLPDDQRLVASFECWTRKEAYLKGVGVGLRAPLDEVEVWDGRSTTTVLDGWRVQSFHLFDGYASAVAAQDAGEWLPPAPRRIGSTEATRTADSIGPRGPLGDGRVPSRENACR